MKKGLFLIAFVFGLLFTSCNTDSASDIEEFQTEESVVNLEIQDSDINENLIRISSFETASRSIGFKEILGFRFHRWANRVFTYDNGHYTVIKCRCEVCFGVCNINKKIARQEGDSPALVTLGSSEGSTVIKLNMLEELPHAEPTFGVDNDIALPEESLEGTEYNAIFLKKGEYEYIPQIEQIEYKGEVVTSYGYVVVYAEVN